MKKYIHYGSKEFNNNRFAPIVNTMMTKPTGGLWASPINCKYGWKEWNKHNELKICDINNSFVFSLRKNAKIIHIYSVKDLKKLPKNRKIPYSDRLMCCLDFEKIVKMGIDAIELHLSEENKKTDFVDGLYFKLYGWDCDSVLVMNPEVIKIKK